MHGCGVVKADKNQSLSKSTMGPLLEEAAQTVLPSASFLPSARAVTSQCRIRACTS